MYSNYERERERARSVPVLSPWQHIGEGRSELHREGGRDIILKGRSSEKREA